MLFESYDIFKVSHEPFDSMAILLSRSICKRAQESHDVGNIESSSVSGIPKAVNDPRIFYLSSTISSVLKEFYTWIIRCACTTTFLTLGNGTLANGYEIVAKRGICHGSMCVDNLLFFVHFSSENCCLFISVNNLVSVGISQPLPIPFRQPIY